MPPSLSPSSRLSLWPPLLLLAWTGAGAAAVARPGAPPEAPAPLPPPAGSDAVKSAEPRPPLLAPKTPAIAGVAQLQKRLDALLARPAFAHGRVGAVVQRLDTGEVLYRRNPGLQLVPASNVKLVTTAAALDGLSADFRFQTEVFGELGANGVVQGPLAVKGYGDPYLVPERISYLASRLLIRGVRRVAGDLVLDDSFFAPEAAVAVGFAEDRSSRAYMAPAGALSVGFNALMVHVVPNAVVGRPAEVLLDPPQAYTSLAGTVATVADGRSQVAVDVVPSGQQSVVRLAGKIRQGEGPKSFWRRIDQPAYFAGHVLHRALAEAGIVVEGRVVRGVTAPEATLLLNFPSPRLAELLVPLNKFSNNFMAMQLALVLGAFHHGAPATWPKAQRALGQFLAEKTGTPPGTYTLNNASGLHMVNAFSADQLVRVLRYAHSQPQFRTEFINSLATAAGSGTLQERMLDGPAAARVRAKTGTLAQASALSGYVDTPCGVPLAFSLLLNGYRHIEDVWAGQDAFAEALASVSLVREVDASAAGAATAVTSHAP